MNPAFFQDEHAALTDPTRQTCAWETCFVCNGSGMGLNMAGEPGNCWECKGEGVIRARDDKGRFLPNPPEPKS